MNENETISTEGLENIDPNIRKEDYDRHVAEVLAQQDPDTADIKGMIKEIYNKHGVRKDFIKGVLPPEVSADEAIGVCADLLGSLGSAREDMEDISELMVRITEIQQRMHESDQQAA